jgi:transcriptional regulator with XRE-family HTH domain
MGETQESLARKLDVSLQTVALWETRRPPQGLALLQLATIAKDHRHDDLAEWFVKAAHLSLDAQARLRIEIQVKAWKDLFRALEEIRREARSIGPLDTGRRILRAAEKLDQSAKEAQKWAMRNRR